MGEIFINYRREDSAGEARALFNEMREKIGANSVFMDVDNIALGRDFREVLAERLATVDVMLALIGHEWTRVTDKNGQRRIDDPNDFVRREIRAALERNIAVTPVLLQDAPMPAEADLPEDIRSLAFRNAFELSHTRWGSDVNELLHRLGFVETGSAHAVPPSFHAEHVDVEASPPPSSASAAPAVASGRSWLRAWPAAVGGVVLLAAASGGYQYYSSQQAEQAALQQAQAEADQRRQEAEAKLARAVAEQASQAEAQARDAARVEAQRVAEARQRAEAEQLAARQRAEAQRMVESNQRAEAQRIADAKQLADRSAREQASRNATAAALLAVQNAQAANSRSAVDVARQQSDAARHMEDVRAGKFIGSISVGLGDYAAWKTLSWQALNAGAALSPCTVWARQLLADKRPYFLASCLGAPAYFSKVSLPLSMRLAQAPWATYCADRARALNASGNNLAMMMRTCQRYR